MFFCPTTYPSFPLPPCLFHFHSPYSVFSLIYSSAVSIAFTVVFLPVFYAAFAVSSVAEQAVSAALATLEGFFQVGVSQCYQRSMSFLTEVAFAITELPARIPLQLWLMLYDPMFLFLSFLMMIFNITRTSLFPRRPFSLIL